MPPGIEASSLREGLRFLWFAHELGTSENGRIDPTSVIRLCRDWAGISSFSPNPILGIQFLVETGLAEERIEGFFLTQVGILIASAAEEPLALNDTQRSYILEHLAANREWSWRLRNVLTRFRIDDQGRLAFVRPLEELSAAEDEALTLLQLIDVTELDGESLILRRDSLKSLADCMQAWLPIPQSDLDEIIKDRMRLADAAEEYVVEWERRRLDSIGQTHLRTLVSRVSLEDVSRGYDIHSVDGENGSDMDRYIEVKCSQGERLSFYWTAREMEVAEQYREQYWIYFIPRANLLPDRCEVLMIQDPIRLKGTLLEMSVATALVDGERLVLREYSTCNFGLGFQGRQWKLDKLTRLTIPEEPKRCRV